MGQRLAAGRLATAGGHAQQAASFDRGHGIELFAQSTDQVGVRLIGLVELQDGQTAQSLGNCCFEAIATGDGT
ncbi:hypothetical protein D3C71_2206420 [compost metagenome]